MSETKNNETPTDESDAGRDTPSESGSGGVTTGWVVMILSIVAAIVVGSLL